MLTFSFIKIACKDDPWFEVSLGDFLEQGLAEALPLVSFELEMLIAKQYDVLAAIPRLYYIHVDEFFHQGGRNGSPCKAQVPQVTRLY